MSMSRLIVISNRVRQPGSGAAQGGLAVALSAALRETRGIWVGWSGEMTERFTGQIALSEDEGIKTATIDLEEQDIDEYYNGYANRTLWPLFHYRIDLAEYNRTFEGGYNRVNERFADTVCPLTEPEDIIWVHDYHMIPLGQMLRDRGLANRSEEHTSELQSLMRISYAVFCLKKKIKHHIKKTTTRTHTNKTSK